MVTATFRKFTHPILRHEPKTVINYPQMPVIDINMHHTNNPNASAKEKIEEISTKYPNEKILVAYNSIQRQPSMVMSCYIEW